MRGCRVPRVSWIVLGLVLAATACRPSPRAPRAEWVLVVHGGAGTIPRTLDPEVRQAYLDGLSRAMEQGRTVLNGGGAALDAVEAVIRTLEDDPHFNAGRGAVFTRDGRHELDASIMDGNDLSCGAVTGVTTVRHPITLARRVMEKTPHVFLGGAGAERFAAEAGVERVDPTWFDTPRRREQLERVLEKERKPGFGTVGAVALDRHGNLAAATSTGGLTAKWPGRIGDSPVIGAGTYADNRSCAVSCTGQGEEFIRHAVAHEVSALMLDGGRTLAQAADRVIHQVLKPGDGGLIAVERDGSVAVEFSTEGMYRGVTDSTGRFELHIWK